MTVSISKSVLQKHLFRISVCINKLWFRLSFETNNFTVILKQCLMAKTMQMWV